MCSLIQACVQLLDTCGVDGKAEVDAALLVLLKDSFKGGSTLDVLFEGEEECPIWLEELIATDTRRKGMSSL